MAAASGDGLGLGRGGVSAFLAGCRAPCSAGRGRGRRARRRRRRAWACSATNHSAGEREARREGDAHRKRDLVHVRIVGRCARFLSLNASVINHLATLPRAFLTGEREYAVSASESCRSRRAVAAALVSASPASAASSYQCEASALRGTVLDRARDRADHRQQGRGHVLPRAKRRARVALPAPLGVVGARRADRPERRVEPSVPSRSPPPRRRRRPAPRAGARPRRPAAGRPGARAACRRSPCRRVGTLDLQARGARRCCSRAPRCCASRRGRVRAGAVRRTARPRSRLVEARGLKLARPGPADRPRRRPRRVQVVGGGAIDPVAARTRRAGLPAGVTLDPTDDWSIQTALNALPAIDDPADAGRAEHHARRPDQDRHAADPARAAARPRGRPASRSSTSRSARRRSARPSVDCARGRGQRRRRRRCSARRAGSCSPTCSSAAAACA